MPAEPRVLGFVDDAHAAGAELPDDSIVQHLLADHGFGDYGRVQHSSVHDGTRHWRHWAMEWNPGTSEPRNPRNPGTLEIHHMTRLPIVDVLGRDVRFALRVLRRTPAFTITSVVTLALVIGACTAVFSLADAILIRPLPYPAPERLALVERTRPRRVAWTER